MLPASSSAAEPAPARTSFVRSLYFRVLVGTAAGITLGIFYPHAAEKFKPLSDAFIKLVRMLVAPIIFLSVVIGVASVGDLKRLGRVGLKALFYFEVVTTFALAIGMLVADTVQPGRGLNIDASKLDASSISQYTTTAQHLTTIDFLLNIIPDSLVGAFTKGEILQVLFLAILSGLALAMLQGAPDSGASKLLAGARAGSHVLFKIVAFVMEAAPLGAFGAMAFTIGKYGLGSLLALGKLLLCVYLTSFAFVFFILGALLLISGVSLWRLLVYLREEVVIVLATSSSESVLPRLLTRMEALGSSPTIVGLVIPAGYSFNLDGTSIYLSVAALFIAQATNTHLTFGNQVFILFILMLNSKGAAAVTGGGFITLAGTLAALGTIPVAGITLLLGVDRMMSEMRSLTNMVGNSVATIMVSKWEGQFDAAQCRRVLASGANTLLEATNDPPVREESKQR